MNSVQHQNTNIVKKKDMKHTHTVKGYPTTISEVQNKMHWSAEKNPKKNDPPPPENLPPPH